MAGRPRKPRALHELDGTARSDRQNAREPLYPVEAPDKPAHIKKRPVANREWDRLVPILVSQRVMGPAFRASLEMYCLVYADVIEAERYRSRLTQAERYGARSQVMVRFYGAQKELRQWAQQLGLTAASVGKVSSAPAPARVSKLALVMARKSDKTG